MKPLWAIIRNTLQMSLRRPTAFVVVLALAVLGPLLGLLAKSDGTLPGQLKLLFTYNFMLLSVISMAILLYLSSFVLDNELTGKQILLLDVKPVPRWQVLLGKWTGLTILSGVLIAIVGAQTYSATMILTSLDDSAAASLLLWLTLAWTWILLGGYIVATRVAAYIQNPWIIRAALTGWILIAFIALGTHLHGMRTSGLRGRPPVQLQNANRQILVSRRSFRPELPDIEKEVKEYRQFLEEQGRLDTTGRLDNRMWSPEELEDHLRRVVSKRIYPIPYRSSRPFRFRHIPPGIARSKGLTVRHHLYGHRGEDKASWITTGWVFANPETGQTLPPIQITSKSGKTREFHSEALAISNQGTMDVYIYNLTGPQGEGESQKPPARINVPLENGIEVLVPIGSFEANYLRGLLLLWVRLMMIAAIGVAINTFVGGPVAAFAVFAIIICGILNSFVYSSVAPRESLLVGQPKKNVATLENIRTQGLRVVLGAVPDFTDTDPVQDLVVGREISWLQLLSQLGADLGLRSGWLVLLGVYAYYRREVGLPLGM